MKSERMTLQPYAYNAVALRGGTAELHPALISTQLPVQKTERRTSCTLRWLPSGPVPTGSRTNSSLVARLA